MVRSKKHNSYTTPRTTCISYHWHDDIENLIKSKIEGYTLHLCSGRSKIGDIKIDLMVWKKFRSSFSKCNVLADANNTPLPDNSFNTVVLDPIYNKLEPPFVDECVRVLKNNGLLIYYYPALPFHSALNLIKLYIYPNQHLKYNRLLSLFRVSKL